MNPTWVTSLPAGTKGGQFLTIDLGGTNLRDCRVDLHGTDRKYDVIRTEHRIPEALKSSTAERLWKYIAFCLHQFLDQHSISVHAAREMPLAFTFSYPVTQHFLHHGILQRWTKGFNVRGVEGRDVVQGLTEVLHQEVRAQRRSPSIFSEDNGNLGPAAAHCGFGKQYGRDTDGIDVRRCQDADRKHIRHRK